jgi:DNA-binding transcriptional LysR family regulator
MANPPRPSLPLVWLKAFEAAARRSSFTAAAKELGLTQAAVSQQIRLLEASLKTTLFRRLRRGVELTSEGAAYLPHIQASFGAIERSTDELFAMRGIETVALRSPISFAALWLAPRLGRLQAVKPNLRLELATIHVPADYASSLPGLDIRFGPGPFAGRTSQRLTHERLAPVGAPELATRFAAGCPWSDIPLLGLTGGREMWPDWFAMAGLSPPHQPACRFDSYIAAQEAAKAGVGALLASRPLVDRALAEGSLIQLSGRELRSEAGHFITHLEGASLSSPEQQLLDWLLSEAGEES